MLVWLWIGLALLVGIAFPALSSNATGTIGRLLPLAIVAATGMLLLAVTRPDWLLVLGFRAAGIRPVEPAPVDLAFLLLIVVVASALRHDESAVPPGVRRAAALCPDHDPLAGQLERLGGRAQVRGDHALPDRARSLPAAMLLNRRSDRAGDQGIHPRRSLHRSPRPPRPQVGLPGGSALVYQGSRVQAFFKDPNVFGPFLVPALASCSRSSLVRASSGGSSIRSAIVAIMLAVGVLFSYSRAAILNLVLAAAHLFGVYLWRRRGRAAAVRLGLQLGICAVAGISLLVVTTH